MNKTFLDIALSTRQVIEADQITIPHFSRVSVILDVTNGLVEVKIGVWHSWITLRVGVIGAARSASSWQ